MKHLITKTYIILAFILVANGDVLWATQPNWWTDYSMVDGSTRRDNAVATIGQAKHVVQKAYQYLEVELATAGGAGAEVAELYNSYCTTAPANPNDDLKSLTIGQLKYLAKPFYDHLNSTGIDFDTRAMNPASTDIYPWTITRTDDDDLALATIGQLKFVFSFDLSAWLSPNDDIDRDSMLDIWEQAIVDADPNDALSAVTDVLPGEDYDSDGLNNLSEFTLKKDPLRNDHPSLKLLLY